MVERGLLEVPGVAIPGAWTLVGGSGGSGGGCGGHGSVGSGVSLEMQRMGARVRKSATGAAAGGFNAVRGGGTGVWDEGLPAAPRQRSGARIQAHPGVAGFLPEAPFSSSPAAHPPLWPAGSGRAAVPADARAPESPRVSAARAELGSPVVTAAMSPTFTLENSGRRLPAAHSPLAAAAPTEMQNSAGSVGAAEASRSSTGNAESFELRSSGEPARAGPRERGTAASAMAAPGAGTTAASSASTARVPLSRSVWSDAGRELAGDLGEARMGMFQGAEARQLALHRALQMKYEAALPLHQQARLSASVASFYTAHSG